MSVRKLNYRGAAIVVAFGALSTAILLATSASRDSVAYPGALIPVFVAIALFVAYTPSFSRGEERSPVQLVTVGIAVATPIVTARLTDGNFVITGVLSATTLFYAWLIAERSRREAGSDIE